MPPDLPSKTFSQRCCWQARVELALARDDYQAALAEIDRLYSSALNLPPSFAASELSASGPITSIPCLGLMKGQALMGMGLYEEAEKWLVGALEGAKRNLSPYLVWRIYWTLGKLFVVDIAP